MKYKQFILLLISIFSSNSHAQSIAQSLLECGVFSDKNYAQTEFFAKISDFFKDKKIVGMGEASHGAHEFFKMKADVFKYLAVHEGFRVFAIESSLSTTYELNKYLLYDEGEPKKALHRLDNFYWYTEEVLELVHWMHSYNQGKSQDEKLWFYGMDAYSSYSSASVIMKYLRKVEPGEGTRLAKYGEGVGKILSSRKKKAVVQRRLIKMIFEKQKNDYISKSSQWEYDFIDRCFVNLEQALKNNGIIDDYRDRCMAENVGWLEQIAHSRIFVWAHNYHISKYQLKHRTMGFYLNAKYKDAYYALGFDFKEGKIWAKKGANLIGVILHGNKNRICTTHPPKEGYFTYELTRLQKPLFFIDLNTCSMQSEHFRKRINSKDYIHDTDEWFAKSTEYSKHILAKAFDGMIYIEKVGPSRHFILDVER